jgi:hypothetical protein
MPRNLRVAVLCAFVLAAAPVSSAETTREIAIDVVAEDAYSEYQWRFRGVIAISPGVPETIRASGTQGKRGEKRGWPVEITISQFASPSEHRILISSMDNETVIQIVNNSFSAVGVRSGRAVGTVFEPTPEQIRSIAADKVPPKKEDPPVELIKFSYSDLDNEFSENAIRGLAIKKRTGSGLAIKHLGTRRRQRTGSGLAIKHLGTRRLVAFAPYFQHNQAQLAPRPHRPLPRRRCAPARQRAAGQA